MQMINIMRKHVCPQYIVTEQLSIGNSSTMWITCSLTDDTYLTHSYSNGNLKHSASH